MIPTLIALTFILGLTAYALSEPECWGEGTEQTGRRVALAAPLALTICVIALVRWIVGAG